MRALLLNGFANEQKHSFWQFNWAGNYADKGYGITKVIIKKPAQIASPNCARAKNILWPL
jgi:hypothetical protein